MENFWNIYILLISEGNLRYSQRDDQSLTTKKCFEVCYDGQLANFFWLVN